MGKARELSGSRFPIAGYSEALGLFELLRTTIRFTPALSPAVAIAEPR